MNKQNISSLGIDISKGYLDIHHLPTQITNRYPNNVEGVEALVHWIKTHSASYIVFEASGGYERILKELLDANQLPYSMVNAGWSVFAILLKQKGYLPRQTALIQES